MEGCRSLVMDEKVKVVGPAGDRWKQKGGSLFFENPRLVRE
jgi:hypothetical protein